MKFATAMAMSLTVLRLTRAFRHAPRLARTIRPLARATPPPVHSFARTLAVRGGGGGDDAPPFPTWSFKSANKEMSTTEVPAVAFSVISELDAAAADDEVLVFGVFGPPDGSDEPFALSAEAAAFDAANGALFTKSIATHAKDFKNASAAGATVPLVSTVRDGALSHATVFSLGSAPGDAAAARGAGAKLGAAAVELAKTAKAKRVTISVPSAFLADGAGETLKAFANAAYAAMYVDNRYRTGDAQVAPFEALVSIRLHAAEAAGAPAATAAALLSIKASADDIFETAAALAAGTYLTKDLVNAPPNVLNPLSMAAVARQIAADSDGYVKAQILDAAEVTARRDGWTRGGDGAPCRVVASARAAVQRQGARNAPPPLRNL